MKIHKSIKRLREKLGISQSELARRIKVTQSLISKIESGEKTPSLALLYDLRKHLGLTDKDIF